MNPSDNFTFWDVKERESLWHVERGIHIKTCFGTLITKLILTACDVNAQMSSEFLHVMCFLSLSLKMMDPLLCEEFISRQHRTQQY